jgi:hypothetical protein
MKITIINNKKTHTMPIPNSIDEFLADSLPKPRLYNCVELIKKAAAINMDMLKVSKIST